MSHSSCNAVVRRTYGFRAAAAGYTNLLSDFDRHNLQNPVESSADLQGVALRGLQPQDASSLVLF